MSFYCSTDIYIDSVPYLSADQKTNIRQWTGDGIISASIGLDDPDDLIANLDQVLKSRTFKGTVGPFAYRLMKKFAG